MEKYDFVFEYFKISVPVNNEKGNKAKYKNKIIED